MIALSLDGMGLSALHRELVQKLQGSRVHRVQQPGSHEIMLKLRVPGETVPLLLSCSPAGPRAHTTSAALSFPPAPPVFCAILRKYLESKHLSRIAMPGWERVLHLYFHAGPEARLPGTFVLTLELMGRHSNLILWDPATGVILEPLRHVGEGISRVRQVLPGLPYEEPPAQSKEDPSQLGELQFYSVLLRSHQSLPSALVANLQGIGPVSAREMVYQAGIDLDATPRIIPRSALAKLYQVLRGQLHALERRQLQPAVMVQDETPVTVSLWPLGHLGQAHSREFGSLNEACDWFYSYRLERQTLESGRARLQQILERHLQRVQRALKNQRETLEKMDRAEEDRIRGELLAAHLHQVQPGQDRVQVVNYYSPRQEFLEIPLDPSLTPAGNVQRFFSDYRKARQGRPQLLQQMRKKKREWTYLQSVLDALQQVETGAELEEVRQEMLTQGYASSRTRKQRQVSGKGSKDRPRPRRFTSRDQLPVLVGKNNGQNETLRREARPDDYWFHVHKRAGSHVLVRWNRPEPLPPDTIEDAASLAAYFSQARGEKTVAVAFTRYRHVRKPRGAPPGMVLYNSHQTVQVNPREQEIEKLKGQAPGEQARDEP